MKLDQKQQTAIVLALSSIRVNDCAEEMVVITNSDEYPLDPSLFLDIETGITCGTFKSRDFNGAELSAVLGALRYAQRKDLDIGLDADGIDELCESLNIGLLDSVGSEWEQEPHSTVGRAAVSTTREVVADAERKSVLLRLSVDVAYQAGASYQNLSREQMIEIGSRWLKSLAHSFDEESFTEDDELQVESFGFKVETLAD